MIFNDMKLYAPDQGDGKFWIFKNGVGLMNTDVTGGVSVTDGESSALSIDSSSIEIILTRNMTTTYAYATTVNVVPCSPYSKVYIEAEIWIDGYYGGSNAVRFGLYQYENNRCREIVADFVSGEEDYSTDNFNIGTYSPYDSVNHYGIFASYAAGGGLNRGLIMNIKNWWLE